MGKYQRGDVILALLALDDRGSKKARPAVVIATGDAGVIRVCPASSTPPSNAPCIPISLEDFSKGGLDLFDESYVMTSRVLTLRSGKVIGKKGQLTTEALAEITRRVPAALLPGARPEQKKSGRSHR
jgi:mRNA interferase MazF